MKVRIEIEVDVSELEFHGLQINLETEFTELATSSIGGSYEKRR